MLYAMKVPIIAMALFATQAVAQCERETRAEQEAMRARDAAATKQAKAALATCRDADRSRYRTVDNPVINDGPPPPNQAEIVRERREAEQQRRIRY
jgi:hypothetical protein